MMIDITDQVLLEEEHANLQAENLYLQEEIKYTHNFKEIISNSKIFHKVLHQIEQVASTDATVLILGESGTGKELLARAVHNISTRNNRALIKINCANLPSNLIERANRLMPLIMMKVCFMSIIRKVPTGIKSKNFIAKTALLMTDLVQM